MGRLEPIEGINIITLHTGEEIRLGHSWHEVDVLKEVIKRERPETFVEIGVHEGGLSYLLLPFMAWKHYIGIEINHGYIRPEVILRYSLLGRDIYSGDCLAEETIEKISQFSGKMIYCDGGNKVAELHAYKEICQSGDLLFTHDYYDGIRKVREVKQPQAEVTPADVADIDNDISFHLYDQTQLRTTRIQGWRKI